MTRDVIVRRSGAVALTATLMAMITASAMGLPAFTRNARAQEAAAPEKTAPETKPPDPKPQGPKDWKQVETDPRMETLKAKLREGAKDADMAFVTSVALPQLSLPANRSRIDFVRRRIREQLSAPATLKVIGDFSERLARDETADLAVRINAMLLLGELTNTPEKQPWPEALKPLLGALADPALPLGVRAAAAVGVGEHVAAGGGAELASAAGPVLLNLVQADPTTADAAAVNWMAGRALRALAQLGLTSPPETIGVALATLVDEARPLDLRVRAAVALGRCAGEGRPLDVPKTLQGIRDLAVEIIGTEKDRANQRALEANLGVAGGMPPDPSMMGMGFPGSPGSMSAVPGFPGGGGFPGGPGGMPASPGFPGAPGSMPAAPGMAPYGGPGYDPGNPGVRMPDESLVLAFRRAAWRLSMLADALDAEGGGISRVAGPLQPVTGMMARVLRDAAVAIDAAPQTASIDKAFKAITGADPSAGQAPAAGQPASGQAPAAGEPGQAPAGQPAIPAAAAGEGNPFAR